MIVNAAIAFLYINAYNKALYNATKEQILLFSALRPCKFLTFLPYGNWNDRPYKLKNVSPPSILLKLKNCLIILKILVRFIELPDKNRVSSIGEE
jgi:hypothetical protein